MSRPSANAAPASADLPTRRLAALRAELDRIDDALHDGLMRRAEVVAQVGALGAKGKVPLRPGREASIIRRLLARNHGALDRSLLVRVWREVLAGSTAQQQAMTVAIGGPSLAAPARAHFGAMTTIEIARNPAAALDALGRGAATVAVLPWPGDDDRWWTTLLDGAPPPAHVVARLPFWRCGRASPPCAVLTTAFPDPSGDDRSLIAAPGSGNAAAFASSGFAVGALAVGAGAALVDVAGFVEAGDARLPEGAVVLGAYAVPMGEPGETE